MPLKSSLRQLVYQTEKLAQAARFASLPEPNDMWPALLGISFPKSGTHLLDQILLGFSKVAPFSTRLHSFYAEYEGESGRKRPPGQALAWLDALGPRDVASAHLFARPETVARVTSNAFVPCFIFRDPRDVVVSHVFYVTEMEPNHVHHDYYASLPDFDARLRTSILGFPSPEPIEGLGFPSPEPVEGRADVEFPHIAGRFAPYLGWLDQPAVLKVHFEDLVNDRVAALNGIIDHVLARIPLRTPRERILEALETSINPAKSPTFRSGRTGEWVKYFTPEHKQIFKATAGDLLLRLGYETGRDW